MDRLQLTHPLEDTAPRVLPDLLMRVIQHQILFELRGNPSAMAERCPGVLPIEPNRAIAHDTWRATWLRPDGWLLSGLEPMSGRAWSGLLSAAEYRVCRLTEITHSRVCFALEGDRAPLLLAKGTPLDLRRHRLGPGQCARTWCAGFTVLLDHVGDAIHVYVDAPLAVAFWDWLCDAALEWQV